MYVLHQQGAGAGVTILTDKKKAYTVYAGAIINNINYGSLVDFYLKYTEQKLLSRKID